ncbi:MAG: transglycosylase SLT domain-containing protein [Actinobacteria bacterium]|nr:transglycosylase SLT domain-containing protein [Actinomycetota bacterium]
MRVEACVDTCLQATYLHKHRPWLGDDREFPLLAVVPVGYAFPIPMRFLRFFPAVIVFSMFLSIAAVDGPSANAQNVDDAEDDAGHAKENADAATGLVDSAVAEREQIERELTESIARVNELSAQLSIVGAGLDRTAQQLGFADVQLAGIQAQIEVQAVDAYMTVLSSPTVSLVNSESVEKALVASSVVEDVVASGRANVDELIIKRRSLQQLQLVYVAEQEEYQALQEEVDAEVEHLVGLYDRADSEVAAAVREAQNADAEYRQALSAVDLARAREEERERQEERSTSTTSPPSTTTPTSPPSTSPPTTSSSNTTTTTSGGDGGPWNHPPSVERWRPLVQQFFPGNRVEEALRIIDCESNGNPDAYNPYSGASGLFQFIPSTWASAAPKAGYGGRSAFEPEANIATAAWLANRYQELGQYYWRAWSCKRVLT